MHSTFTVAKGMIPKGNRKDRD